MEQVRWRMVIMVEGATVPVVVVVTIARPQVVEVDSGPVVGCPTRKLVVVDVGSGGWRATPELVILETIYIHTWCCDS